MIYSFALNNIFYKKVNNNKYYLNNNKINNKISNFINNNSNSTSKTNIYSNNLKIVSKINNKHDIFISIKINNNFKFENNKINQFSMHY